MHADRRSCPVKKPAVVRDTGSPPPGLARSTEPAACIISTRQRDGKEDASTEGITHYLKPAVAGLLMEKEITYLGKALEAPEKPFVAIIGGSKISGKIDVIQNLLDKVNTLVIVGGMAYTFYRSKGIAVGKSLVEEDKIDLAGKRW